MEINKKHLIVGIGVVAAIVIAGIGVTKASNATKADSINNQIEVSASSSGSVFVMDERSVSKDEATQTPKNPLADRNVYFAGYVDATLSKTSTVALENLPDNEEFLLKYTITNEDTGEVVFETDLISSGQCVAWTPGETLDAGTYNLQFLASPYYQAEDGGFVPLTAGSNTVVYKITE